MRRIVLLAGMLVLIMVKMNNSDTGLNHKSVEVAGNTSDNKNGSGSKYTDNNSNKNNSVDKTITSKKHNNDNDNNKSNQQEYQ